MIKFPVSSIVLSSAPTESVMNSPTAVRATSRESVSLDMQSSTISLPDVRESSEVNSKSTTPSESSATTSDHPTQRSSTSSTLVNSPAPTNLTTTPTSEAPLQTSGASECCSTIFPIKVRLSKMNKSQTRNQGFNTITVWGFI